MIVETVQLENGVMKHQRLKVTALLATIVLLELTLRKSILVQMERQVRQALVIQHQLNVSMELLVSTIRKEQVIVMETHQSVQQSTWCVLQEVTNQKIVPQERTF